jgi:predicted ATPase with chaperone activity
MSLAGPTPLCIQPLTIFEEPYVEYSLGGQVEAGAAPHYPPVAEVLNTICIHCVAGLTGDRTAWVTTRPFRAPHQTISDAGLIGGGHVPLPGEVSLAHHGVLFLDERPECRRHVLKVLRQPLEERVTRIHFRSIYRGL